MRISKGFLFTVGWCVFLYFLSLLILSKMASANDLLNGYTGSAEANATGTILNQNSQYNNLFGGYLPSTEFSLDSVRCPTAQFTVGALPNYTHHQLGHQEGVSAVVGLNMPVDFNGTLKRCRQQQSALITRIKTDREFAIVSVCKNAHEAGIALDPQVFEWAVYCNAMNFKGPSKAEVEAQAQLANLKAENEALRREATKMLRAATRK